MKKQPRGIASNDEVQSAIHEIVHRTDLPTLAKDLGIDVVGEGAAARAICPFHDDHRPSLRFYRSPESVGNVLDLFKCFACGAHGNAITLARHKLDAEFRDAVQWLARRTGAASPWGDAANRRPHRSLDAMADFDFANSILSRSTSEEKSLLADWATTRGFSAEMLTRAGVFAAVGSKLTRELHLTSRSYEELSRLQSTRLVSLVHGDVAQAKLFPAQPRDFFVTDRILFTIRDIKSTIIGFAGRTISTTDRIKYLFSPGFPRREALYRIEHVSAEIDRLSKRRKAAARSRGPRPRVDIYITEGFADALRLESLGLLSVAILGNQLTTQQCELLLRLASVAHDRGCDVFFHVFLDQDDAGWIGTRVAIKQLVQTASKLVRRVDFGLTVICVADHAGSVAKDPDELLRTDDSAESAALNSASRLIGGWTLSPLRFLFADAMECPPRAVDSEWRSRSTSERVSILRDLEQLIGPDSWRYAFEQILPASDGLFGSTFVSSDLATE